MKHIITLVTKDGTEIKFDANTKITIQYTLVGEDAIYETVCKGAFIKDLNIENCEVTIKFEADYCKEVLKSTK